MNQISKVLKTKFIHIVIWLALLTACSSEVDWQGGGEATPSTFQWTRGVVEETRIAFLRNFGVGYGYNAVNGRYCCYDDIRSQVLNRRQLEQASIDLQERLFFTDYSTHASYRDTVAYSLHDYVAIFNLDEKSSIDCVVYKQEQSIRQNILEDGVRQSFYYCADEVQQVAQQYLNVTSMRAAMKAGIDPQQLLTQSFRDAVRHLGDSNDPASVDSFIKVYGTHVVVSAAVGGRLHMDLKNSMKRYSRRLQVDKFKTEDLLYAFKSRTENRQLSEQYQWIEDGSLCVSAYGGDQSLLSQLLGEQRYDGTRNFDLSQLDKWRKSITFVPDDEYASTAEMINMTVVPIWEFAFDADASAKLRARIMQDAAQARLLLGERNFSSCFFPLRHAVASCQIAKGSNWETVSHRVGNRSDRHVVFVVSQERYVAMLSYEYLSVKGGRGQYFWTVYPVYDGYVKLQCGYAVSEDDGRLHRLMMDDGWLKAVPVSQEEQPEQTEMVYLNAGTLSFVRQDGFVYASADPMLYVEPTHGVNPDGTVDVSCVVVDKDAPNEFVITIPADGPLDLGDEWTLESSGYDRNKQRVNTYTRPADYIGYYNPREVRPVK